MKLINRPPTTGEALRWVWLLPGLVPLEYLIRGPFAWWNMPWVTLVALACASALVALLTEAMSRWSFSATLWWTRSALLAWLILELIFLWQRPELSQRLLSLGLIGFCGYYELVWMREGRRAYWNRQVPWYVGVPARVPGIRLELEGATAPAAAGSESEKSAGLSWELAEVDEWGAFLVARGCDASRLQKIMRTLTRGTTARLIFDGEEDTALEVPLRWVMWDRDRLGIGVRFAPEGPIQAEEWRGFLAAVERRGWIA